MELPGFTNKSITHLVGIEFQINSEWAFRMSVSEIHPVIYTAPLIGNRESQ